MAIGLRGLAGVLLALALGACAAPARGPAAAPAPADLWPEVFAVVEANYVEVPDFAAMRLGALRALEQEVPGGAFRVSGDQATAAVTYEVPGRAAETTVFVGRGRDGVARDVRAAIAMARQLAPALSASTLDHLALKKALASLDPHSGYLDPEAYRETRAETSGSFGGIGIEIAIRNDEVAVIAPLEATPAWRAGIRAGDRIVRIAGAPTKGLSLGDVVRRLRGPKGSVVTITVARDGVPAPLEVSLTRDIITVQSVQVQEIEPGLAYVRVRQFQERTARDLEAGLEPLRKSGRLAGLVLDLRNNPGGLLTAGVEVAERFLADGRLIVSTEGRAPSQRMRFVAHGARPLVDVPLVVLVNRGSASAAEIVAAAIQDHGRGILVGQTTFGKGSVQTIIPLTGGSGLRLTTAHYFTPRGRSIQGQGVRPDVALEEPAATAASAPPSGPEAAPPRSDLQLERGLAELRALAGPKPGRR